MCATGSEPANRNLNCPRKWIKISNKFFDPDRPTVRSKSNGTVITTQVLYTYQNEKVTCNGRRSVAIERKYLSLLGLR